MTTQPLPPPEHYREAERLLAATEETPASGPLLAIAHAILANVPPRRAPRHRHAHYVASAGPATLGERWARGDFDKPKDGDESSSKDLTD